MFRHPERSHRFVQRTDGGVEGSYARVRFRRGPEKGFFTVLCGEQDDTAAVETPLSDIAKRSKHGILRFAQNDNLIVLWELPPVGSKIR